MAENTVTGALHAYLQRCPLLADGKLNVDFLPARGVEYSLDLSPTTPVMKRYTDGSSIRQLNFVVRTQHAYDGEVLQSIANTGFFEALADWMERETRSGSLRASLALPGGKTAQSMEAQTTGYLYAPRENVGRWQIQCRLQYLQENLEETV